MPRRRKNRKRSWVFPIVAVLALALIIGWAVSQRGVNASQQAGNADYEILARYPHDVDAYTQGLYFEDGFLFEGTGRPGTSWLRKVEINTGNVLQEISLSSQFFGEGIVTLDSRIFQLTWHSGLGFIYDKDTFRQIGQFRYPGEGWGLATDGESLIMSDGSASLRFLDPDSFTEVRRIEVRGPSGPIMDLNELEFINGSVYANVWFSNSILQIDPSSGEVLREIDFTPLYIDARPSESDAVLNGIAYDSETDRLFVTGKLWPTMYEIRLKTP